MKETRLRTRQVRVQSGENNREERERLRGNETTDIQGKVQIQRSPQCMHYPQINITTVQFTLHDTRGAVTFPRSLSGRN